MDNLNCFKWNELTENGESLEYYAHSKGDLPFLFLFKNALEDYAFKDWFQEKYPLYSILKRAYEEVPEFASLISELDEKACLYEQEEKKQDMFHQDWEINFG